jgi:phosphoglycolate phosphatase
MSQHIADHIKVVFFDHDDTLVGTIGPKWEEHKFIAKQYYGKTLTDEEIIEHWGKPLQELVCLLYGTDNAGEALARNMAHHEEYPKVIFAEAPSTIKHVHAIGKQIGIITATHRFSFELDLERHNIPMEIIDYTQTSDDTPYHKPDPRVFEPALIWLKKQNVKPGEVLYVGDGLHDMKAAIGAGFSFLGVETGLVTAEQFVAHKATSIPDISHLIGSSPSA